MHHAELVTTTDLAAYADTLAAEAVIPELVSRLIKDSASDITRCRMPHSDAVGLPGVDGIVETIKGYSSFIPAGTSYWEIGTGGKPQDKATSDYTKRTKELSRKDRAAATFVFVTPHASKWTEKAQRTWINNRAKDGWKAIKILDGVQLADWLREFPFWGKWLLTKIGTVTRMRGIATPAEHWANLSSFSQPEDPALPPQLFLVGRDAAVQTLTELFEGKIKVANFGYESEQDVDDFVSAFIAEASTHDPPPTHRRCILISDDDAWMGMTQLPHRHILVANPKLDLERSGEQLFLEAKKRHAVVVPLAGAAASGVGSLLQLRSPSAAAIERVLIEAKFKPARARALAAAGAHSLSALKRNLRGLGGLPPYATRPDARAVTQANLAGRWSGKNKSDRKAMEDLLGKKYGEWIETLRSEALRSDTPLSQRDEQWKVISRGEAWTALGPRVSDDDLDRLHKVALAVLGEKNPKFKLAKEQRFAAGIRGQTLKHSDGLREGLAETIALLGAQPEALTSCSVGKAALTAVLTVRALLQKADWIQWASLNNVLPLLAEAAPGEFLKQVAAGLESSKAPFRKIFAQEGDGITGGNYMTGLLWALETLAWSPQYLVEVITLLGELASIDPGGNWSNRPINSITDILLPWHYQTTASIPQRRASVEALLRDQPAVGWKVLFALLPKSYGATSGSRRPTWLPLVPPDFPEGVTHAEYWEQVRAYADLAATLAAVDVPKLGELIDYLPDLPEPARQRVLTHLCSTEVTALPDDARVTLWEALVDLAAKHRKFAEAKWALPPAVVAEIESAAKSVEPTSLLYRNRRIFSDRDHDLFDHTGDYTAQLQALDNDRTVVVAAVYRADGIEGVINLARQAASPYKVGEALGRDATLPAEAALLPAKLVSIDPVELAVVRGFVWRRFWGQRVVWLSSLPVASWSTAERNAFLSMLPFTAEIWTFATSVLGSASEDYWQVAQVNPWGEEPEALTPAVEKLLEAGRPRAALVCLYRICAAKKPVPPELSIKVLLAAVPDKGEAVRFDAHEIGSVIEALQEDPSTNQDGLFQVEWAYLPILDPDFGGSPKGMEQRLADNPEFFIELIRMIFRSDKGPKKKPMPEEMRKMAQNAYRLLRAWRKVPGTNPEGNFSPVAFADWAAKMKALASESGHLRVAQSEFGQTLPYAPADPKSLWIHRAVASVLNAKDAEAIRSGFTMEMFNQRGVHGFTSGIEEKKLADEIRAKAEAVELAGFHRFATALRDLADSYDRDAERESKRSLFED